MVRRWMFLVLLTGIVAAGGGARAQEAATAKPQERSSAATRQARGQDAARAFMMGSYDEALRIYLDLYVDSDGRVEYLRNIGRCQQRLGQHERAIQSFKDYLLRGKMSAAERAEVKSFVQESEEARAAAAPTPPAPVLAPATGMPSPPEGTSTGLIVAPPTAGAPPAAPVVPASAPAAIPPSPPPASAAISQPPPGGTSLAPAADGTPADATGGGRGLRITGRVLLIGAAALAVAGTVTLFVARSKFDSAKEHGCPGPADCRDMASSVSTANHLSQAMYVGAAAAGAIGGVLLFLAPTRESGATGVAFGARFTF